MESVFTLAHELGHAMHSYFSDTTQCYTLADYSIFNAEIASTTNEVLLLKYFYSHAKTKEEKVYFLDRYLKMFKSTIFRQTMFSEFEHFVHTKVEADEPLSKKILLDYYAKLNAKYQGPAVEPCEEISYEWSRIPHFYRPYYVYKYATGLISAVCIASNILNDVDEALPRYREFLRSGGNDYPTEILKKAGVDLTQDEAYDIAFAEMSWALEELEKLTK
jgi:oligoendopeptidase F